MIEKSETDEQNFAELTRVTENVDTYTDESISNGVKYYYRVCAYKDTMLSCMSNIADAIGIVTGVKELPNEIPKEYTLQQNYPNPFNPSTVIRYGLPTESMVVIKIYNMLGQEVTVLKNNAESAGYHEVRWEADKVASGVYLYMIKAESANGDRNTFIVKKMLLMK